MAACMRGEGPSEYASDHMLGYLDNLAELKIAQRMLLERRRMKKYVTDDGRLVTISEPASADRTRFIQCTLEEAEEIAGQIDELVSRGRRFQAHSHDSETCVTCGGRRCALCARPMIIEGENKCACEPEGVECAS